MISLTLVAFSSNLASRASPMMSCRRIGPAVQGWGCLYASTDEGPRAASVALRRVPGAIDKPRDDGVDASAVKASQAVDLVVRSFISRCSHSKAPLART